MNKQNMYRITVLVPKTHTDKIIEAMAQAGAGVIGEYTHNAYITHGEGNWFSGEGTNPTIGEVGKMSREPEDKVEMVCPMDIVYEVLNACKNTHPYETPNIQIEEVTLLL